MSCYLFRKDSMKFYDLTEQQVYDKGLELYRKALKLDPDNFPLASDVAQTYYGIKPLRLEDALKAWTNTLAIAHDEIEREGVYLHFARLKLQADRFAEVRAHLNAVTNDMYTVLKKRLMRNLDEQERKAKGTNAPPAVVKEKRVARTVRPSSDLGLGRNPAAFGSARALCSASFTASSRAGSSIGWFACRLGNSSSRW